MCDDMQPQAPSEVLSHRIQTGAPLNHSGQSAPCGLGLSRIGPASERETLRNDEQPLSIQNRCSEAISEGFRR